MPGLIPEATGQPGGGASLDPFGMMNSLMAFKLKMNENQMFQTKYQAGQAFGEIMANSPSVEEGLAQARANPLISGFAQDQILTANEIALRQAQTAQVGQAMSATKLAMGKSGLEGVMSAGLNAANDPQNWNKYFDTGMQGLDPSTLPYVKPKVDAVKQMIAAKIQGLDLSDPTQLETARRAITSAIAGGASSAGVSSDQIKTFTGSAGVTPEGYIVQTPPLISTAGRPGGIVPAQAPQAPGGPTAQPPVQSGLENPASGKPMDTTPNTPKFLSGAGPNIYGEVHFANPAAQEAENDYQKSYAGPERDSYNGARNTKSILAQMDTALDDIVKTNTFYEPGAVSGLRGEIGKLKELFYAATGKQPTGLDKFLPNINADVQIINKMYSQLTSAQAQQTEGTGRKALGVLEMASHAVPGMENTPLGFKVLSAGLGAMADFNIARYNFKNQWKQNPASFGTLTGADQRFNDQVSPEDLARKELKNFGMTLTKDGSMSFENDDQLNRAFTSGLIGKVGSQVRKDNYDHFYEILHPSTPQK